MTSPAELFDGCRTINETNSLFSDLSRERQTFCANEVDLSDLQELHRRAMDRLISERDNKVVKIPDTESSDRVRPRVLRNWAMRQGISLARKGTVPIEIENQYRVAHDLPVRDGPPAKIDRAASGVSDAQVRQWARANDIPVGVRGRVHPDLIQRYLEEHPE